MSTEETASIPTEKALTKQTVPTEIVVLDGGPEDIAETVINEQASDDDSPADLSPVKTNSLKIDTTGTTPVNVISSASDNKTFGERDIRGMWDIFLTTYLIFNY